MEAEGGKVALVARRHRISESLLYNWRSAWKAAAAARCEAGAAEFMPLGVFGRGDGGGPALLAAPQAARSERVAECGPAGAGRHDRDRPAERRPLSASMPS